GLQYSGPQTSSESSGSRLDKKILVQLGLRHQLDWGNAKLQLRFQVSNLFNRDTWEVDSDNTFIPGRPRSWRLIMTLTH
ncbi:TonB-dependent receptor, partial [Undibacterium luofuense]